MLETPHVCLTNVCWTLCQNGRPWAPPQGKRMEGPLAAFDLMACSALLVSGGRAMVQTQGSRIRVCGPMLGVISETSGSPDALTKPTEYEASKRPQRRLRACF